MIEKEGGNDRKGVARLSKKKAYSKVGHIVPPEVCAPPLFARF